MALQDTDDLLVSRAGTNYRMPAVQLKDYAGARVTLSETAPVDPDIGVLWWNSSTGRLYVWYGDVDSAQWVETSPQGIDENIFVNAAGDTMTGPLTVPNLNTASVNGGQLAGLRNRIINGDFRLDQRFGGVGHAYAAGNPLAYVADRWYGYCTGANVTGQRITVAGTQADPFRYQFTGIASTTAIGFGQRIEAQNCRDLAGKTATLRLSLRNSLLTTVTWTAFYANTDDTFGSLAVPTKTQIATGTFTVNSTYSRHTTQIAIPAAATTGIEIVFTVGAQTSGTWVIGQVQLEEGSTATPFERRPVGMELSLCQRYYCLQTAIAHSGSTGAGWVVETPVYFPVQMRTTPTSSGPIGSSNTNITSATFAVVSSQCARFIVIAAGAGDMYSINGYGTFSAEL